MQVEFQLDTMSINVLLKKSMNARASSGGRRLGLTFVFQFPSRSWSLPLRLLLSQPGARHERQDTAR